MAAVRSAQSAVYYEAVAGADRDRTRPTPSAMARPMNWPALLAFLVGACHDTTPPERYGFVTLLGRDTVAVERISRWPTRLVTDGVDRRPFVRRRHTVFDRAADGTIRHMVMDVRTPNGRSPAERGRRVSADATHGALSMSWGTFRWTGAVVVR